MSRICFLLFIIIFVSCTDRPRKTLAPNENDPKNSELAGAISGVITSENSPYYITKSIVIDSLHNLIIEPGVKLLFNDSAHFTVNGGLDAVGTSFNPITFSSHQTNWRGIRIENTSQAVTFQFVIIENIVLESTDSTDIGAINIDQSAVTLQNSIIRNNYTPQGGGLLIYDAKAVIKNNIFRENKAISYGGAILVYSAQAEIINNIFLNNFCWNYGGGIVLIYPEAVDIQNNIFSRNTGKAGDPNVAIKVADSFNYNISYNFMETNGQIPQFRSNDDLHLQPDSPCIDAGNPGVSYNDFNGSRNDQGAYGGPLGNW